MTLVYRNRHKVQMAFSKLLGLFEKIIAFAGQAMSVITVIERYIIFEEFITS